MSLLCQTIVLLFHNLFCQQRGPVPALRKQTRQSFGRDQYSFPLTSDPAGGAGGAFLLSRPGLGRPAAAALVGDGDVVGGRQRAARLLADLTAGRPCGASHGGARKTNV